MATRVIPTMFLLLAVFAVGIAEKNCCFPDQFVAVLGGFVRIVVSGKVVNTQFYGQIANDVPNKRQGYITHTVVAGSPDTTRVISDYSNYKQYIIHETTKSCVTSFLGTAFMRCIPDNAVNEGETYVGDHKLNVNVWKYYTKQEPFVGNVTFTTSVGDCVPLSTLSFVEGVASGEPRLQLVGYTNYTKGIADPARFFTIPKYCS